MVFTLLVSQTFLAAVKLRRDVLVGAEEWLLATAPRHVDVQVPQGLHFGLTNFLFLALKC